MPTKKQLNRILATQFQYFGGSGLPRQSYESSTDGHGLAAEKTVDRPIISRKRTRRFSGKKIGKIRLDPKTNDLKIIVNKKK